MERFGIHWRRGGQLGYFFVGATSWMGLDGGETVGEIVSKSETRVLGTQSVH
jgi:hypothetical protein